MKHRTVLAILASVLLGCESAPPEPSVPTGIAVSALVRGRLSGARAYFAVHAPVQVALDVILDFDRYAEFRPGVVESRTISAFQEGGQAFIRFQGQYADEINASCDYLISESDGVHVVEYQMADPSFSLWALQGTYTLTPARNGEWTVIDREVLVSSLASSVEESLKTVRADSEAIRKRIEEVAGSR